MPPKHACAPTTAPIPPYPGADYKNTLCAKAENPNPPDPQHTGQVLDPIVDWCNFPARLRQAVREAAYLRMVFAQQFMVDALGLHFSAGTLLGGETFVRQEVAKLQAAQYQFELAQQGLSEAFGYRLGSGCYLSDFYTQNEWALLSKAADDQLSAQHQVATRLSYLDINTASDMPRAQSAAIDVYRAGSTQAYVKMIGLAGMSAINDPGGASCTAKGAQPDSALVAEMTLTMLDTRAAAREMRDQRNIFGFDIRFTPSRPYHTAFGSTDKGLWEQAKEAADLALQIQQQTENAERVFDLNQQDLTKAILATNNKVDNEIQIEVGCDLQGFATDQEWYSCIDSMIQHTLECDPQSDTFDACMARTTDGQPPRSDGTNWLILVSDMRTARQDLRTAWLGVKAAITKRDNIVKRADTEAMRNTKVKSAVFTGAVENSVFEAIIAAAQFIDVDIKGEVTFHPGAVVEAGLRPAQIMRQAAHDMEIEDANSEAVVRNLFYDMAEAQGEIDIAAQQYQSMLTQFNGVVGQTGHDVYQSKREHAYTTALPANDPSYRMTRDSRRLELAVQLETAARLAYLAARRAEYEYTARLSANNFRISDIYKARTANDILKFLQDLDVAVSNLPGGVRDAETNQSDLTISVAQHILGSDRPLPQGARCRRCRPPGRAHEALPPVGGAEHDPWQRRQARPGLQLRHLVRRQRHHQPGGDAGLRLLLASQGRRHRPAQGRQQRLWHQPGLGAGRQPRLPPGARQPKRRGRPDLLRRLSLRLPADPARCAAGVGVPRRPADRHRYRPLQRRRQWGARQRCARLQHARLPRPPAGIQRLAGRRQRRLAQRHSARPQPAAADGHRVEDQHHLRVPQRQHAAVLGAVRACGLLGEKERTMQTKWSKLAIGVLLLAGGAAALLGLSHSLGLRTAAAVGTAGTLAPAAVQAAVQLQGEYSGPVKLNVTVAGVYSDTLATPMPPDQGGPTLPDLGSIDLSLQLTPTGGVLTGYVNLDKTLIYSVEHTLGTGPTGVKIGPYVGGIFDGTSFVLQSEKVGLVVSGRPVQRQFRLTGQLASADGGQVAGEYRETLWGYAPAPVTVIGSFTLQRPGYGSPVPVTGSSRVEAVADTAVTAPGVPVTINVLANDKDANGAALAITSVSKPQFGAATTDGKSVTYTPNANFTGTDSFSYFVASAGGATAGSSVTVTVTPVRSRRRPLARAARAAKSTSTSRRSAASGGSA